MDPSSSDPWTHLGSGRSTIAKAPFFTKTPLSGPNMLACSGCLGVIKTLFSFKTWLVLVSKKTKFLKSKILQVTLLRLRMAFVVAFLLGTHWWPSFYSCFVFFSISKLPISWGITFVVLFPKMIIHSLLTISILFFLCNVSYKIISKSLLLVLSWWFIIWLVKSKVGLFLGTPPLIISSRPKKSPIRLSLIQSLPLDVDQSRFWKGFWYNRVVFHSCHHVQNELSFNMDFVGSIVSLFLFILPSY